MGMQKGMVGAVLMLCLTMAWGKELNFFEKAKQQDRFLPVYKVSMPTGDGQDTIEMRMDVAAKGKNKHIASVLVYTRMVQIKTRESVQALGNALFDCQNQSISYGQSYVSVDEKGVEVVPLAWETDFKNKAQMLAEGLDEDQTQKERDMAIDLTNKMFAKLNEVACLGEQ